MRAGSAGGVAGQGVKAQERLRDMLADPDTPLHPAVADVSSMPSFCSLDSLQEPLVAMTMRDLDVSCQGLMIPLSHLTVM